MKTGYCCYLCAAFMKKIIASISFLCYFTFTCGIVINSQYCMERLTSVHLFEIAADTCGKCGMDIHDSNGCCRDEIKVLKLVQDQDKLPVVSYQVTAPEIISATPSDFIVASLKKDDTKHHFNNHSPPLLSEQDTYLQNNVFRI